MTPKIDYVLLGRAVEEYKRRGYVYKEVPWMVPEEAIRATLPAPAPSYVACPRHKYPDGGFDAFVEACYLVGSAEQSFLQMRPKPGAYVGVTPCFRHEPTLDLLHQTTFMKVELFATLEDASLDRVIYDASEVMSLYTDQPILPVATADGFDLTISGIEVGSYGVREHSVFGKWIYGTGLALPRFSVANALSAIA